MKMIKWEGGEMPVPVGTPIKVELRSGVEFVAIAGDVHSSDWGHGVDSVFKECDGDIVAYAVLEPDPELGQPELGQPDQWEYTLGVMPRGTVGEIRDCLNFFGADGWELCCTDYGHLIFKRRKA